MQKLPLNGTWRLVQPEKGIDIPAQVPGCVHTDLLAAGEIADPFYRGNELSVFWVAESSWTYRRTFHVPSTLLFRDAVRLRCAGLDTLAAIRLNGREVGRTDNMFRTWEFDVKGLLEPGQNEIEVGFESAVQYGQARTAERMLKSWGVDEGYKLVGGNYLRKAQSSFGWDWGPRLATCGIWREIELLAFDTGRLRDVTVLQEHRDPHHVSLRVDIAVESAGRGNLVSHIDVLFEGESVAGAVVPVVSGHTAAVLAVADPHLWWPNGLGEQPLYELVVRLTDPADRPLDERRRRIGLRTLELVREPDGWGESFYFQVNGVPFFAKGANWIPADSFLPRLSSENYTKLLGDAAAVHMNMLRVWGGGIYEDDAFYDRCDELGICVWQDFMFACAAYPVFDEEWLATVSAEIADNIRRLRHHPCLALWCGNNELEQGLVADDYSDTTMSWSDYVKLFEQIIPDLLDELDPQTAYWPGSPHSPRGNRLDWNNPRWGDAHIWDVWHGRQPFEFYRTCEHRFNSEFGFQSFPDPHTTRRFTTADDRNITSLVMEHHQRSGIGNQTIMHYLLDWFRLPTSFDHTLWLSQIVQGMAIKYAVEHWRRSMPRGMGTLYWQLNDCWPVASWSSLDYYGRWKALHYMARDFYAPLMLSGIEKPDEGVIDLYLTHDGTADQAGVIHWQIWTVDGERLASGEAAAIAPALASRRALTVDCRQPLENHGPNRLLVDCAFLVEGAAVARNLVLFARPKHFSLPDPEIALAIEEAAGGEAVVTLQCRRPALWVWLDTTRDDLRFSDNFFHLLPGDSRSVRVTSETDASLQDLPDSLVARSLVDTYQER